jgi:hypothetical protein
MIRRYSVLAALLVALTTLAITIWGLGWLRSGLSQEQKQPLELSLSVSKESFLVGEPVLIQQRLTNKSDKELKVDLSLDLRRHHDQIAFGDGPFQPYLPLAAEILTTKLIIDFEPVIITLKPGESREDSGFVLFNAKTNDYAFPAPGRYRYKYELLYDPEDLSKKAESNVLEIKVVAPEREVDQKALQFIIDHQLKPFLNPSEVTYLPTEEQDTSKIVTQFKELLKQFPESIYAPYAQQVIEKLCREEHELPACLGSLEEKRSVATEPLILSIKSVNLLGRKEQKEFLLHQMHTWLG